MNLLRAGWLRLRALFGREGLDREMNAEMRAHLEFETEQNIRRGMTPTDARWAARRSFGGMDQLKERERDARGFRWWHEFRQDLRHGARVMLKQPGFSAVAVLTLALGLSVNITVFSVISFFFFKPLPVPEPDRLVVLARQIPSEQLALPFSWLDYEDVRNEVPEFRDALAVMLRPAHLSVPGRTPERAWLETVSSNYFDMLQVRPLYGRLFHRDEALHAGANPVVVLNHDFWLTKLGGDPAIVGRPIIINEQSFEVIGVAAPEFQSAQWSLAPSAYIPATMIGVLAEREGPALESREWPMFKVYAYLQPGATVEQARTSAGLVYQRLAGLHADPEKEKAVKVLVRPEMMSRPDPSVAGVMPFVAAVFMGLVLLVLLIACANVANLLFARALSRQREMGIRSALGASRGRLTRQLLTESLLLALVAGAVGLVLSLYADPLLQHLVPGGEMPMRPDESWDWNMVWFTVIASVLAGVMMGLIPARRATRGDVQSVIKGAPVENGRTRHWFRSGLVVAQVSFCVIVLVCGGLFLRSLNRSARIDIGVRPAGLLLASVDPALNGYDEARGRLLIEKAVERIEALPGVASASFATSVPFSNHFAVNAVRRAEDAALTSEEARSQEVQSVVNRVHRGYLETAGATLAEGRGITREDTEDSRPVVVINQVLAERLFPDGGAVGRSVVVVDGDTRPREVVGVIRDGRYVTLNEAPRGYIVLPLSQSYSGPLTLHVRVERGRTDAAALLPSVRRVLQEIDPNLPIFEVRTMDEHLRESVFGYMPLRLAACFSAVQGGLGLLLAVMGIYGVVAYSVGQRTREIGVRMALGAAPRDVLRLVMRGGLRLTVTGLACGFLVAFGLSHILSGLLYGLNPVDGLVFGGTLVLLAGIAALACYFPARRALRVDPIRALRAE